MPYIIISTVALLSNLYKNAPLIVGDKDSDPELMRYLGARITTNYPACGSPPMYVMHAPPRAVFDNLEKRGYCLLSAQTIQEHTVWILARPRNPVDDKTEISKGGPNDKSIQAFEDENGKSLPSQGMSSSKTPAPNSVGTPGSPASLRPATSTPPQGTTSPKTSPGDSKGPPATLHSEISTPPQGALGTPTSPAPLSTLPQGPIPSKTPDLKSVKLVPSDAPKHPNNETETTPQGILSQEVHFQRSTPVTSDNKELSHTEKEVEEIRSHPLPHPTKTVHSRGTSPTDTQRHRKLKDFVDDQESLVETSSQTLYEPEKTPFSTKKSIILKETNETVEYKELVSIQPKREITQETQQRSITPRTKARPQKVEKREERPITPTKKYIALKAAVPQKVEKREEPPITPTKKYIGLKADSAPKTPPTRTREGDKAAQERDPSGNETDAANIASKGDASVEWLGNEKVHTRIQVYGPDETKYSSRTKSHSFSSVSNSKGTTAIADDIDEARKRFSRNYQANLSSQTMVFASDIWEHRGGSGSFFSFSSEKDKKKPNDGEPLMLDSWTQTYSYMFKEPQICTPKPSHLVSSCIGGPTNTLLENPIFAHTDLKHLACLTQEYCCCED